MIGLFNNVNTSKAVDFYLTEREYIALDNIFIIYTWHYSI